MPLALLPAVPGSNRIGRTSSRNHSKNEVPLVGAKKTSREREGRASEMPVAPHTEDPCFVPSHTEPHSDIIGLPFAQLEHNTVEHFILHLVKEWVVD